MAVAKTVTKLKLDHFAQIMGLNPLHFNQVYVPGYEAKVCGEPIYQYSWQNADRVGREEMAQAIGEAERLIEDNLYYKILPTYEVDERITIDPRSVRVPAVKLGWGYFISGGIRTVSSVATGSAVTYSAADSVGYKHTGTVTAAVTFTDKEEVAIYYPGHNGDDSWRIEPTSVVIAAGIATIVVPRERLVIETDLEGYGEDVAVDGTDDTQFLTTVDISRDYLDGSQQADLLYLNQQVVQWGIANEYSAQTASLLARDYMSSVVRVIPGNWDSTTQSYTPQTCIGGRWPEIARVWYRAGWQDKSLTYPVRVLDEQWARAVSYLAVTMLDRPLCGCNSLDKITSYYGVDILLETDQERYNIKTNNDLVNNPIGTTRAAINAWKLIQNRYIGQGVVSL